MKKKDFGSITEDVKTILLEHHWLGDIDDLQNLIQRIVLLYKNNENTEDRSEYVVNKKKTDLIPGNFELPEDKLDLKRMEREIVKKVMQKFNGNKSKASEFLCITRSSLRSKL